MNTQQEIGMKLDVREMADSVVWCQDRIQFSESSIELMLVILSKLVDEHEGIDLNLRSEWTGELMKLHHSLQQSYYQR